MPDLAGKGLRAVWPVGSLAILVMVAATIAGQGGAILNEVVITALMNLVLVIGLYIFIGNSGVFSFGHMSFLGVGAYTAALLVYPVEVKHVQYPQLPNFIENAHWEPISATIAGGVVAAACASVIGLPLMRLSGIAASLSTVAVLVIAQVVATNWQELTNGAAGLSGIPNNTQRSDALVWALIAMVAAYVFQRSRVGLRLRASREDEVAAQAYGVGVVGERRIAWVLSAFFVGAGGALYAQSVGTFTPSAFYVSITVTTLAMLVVGGTTSLAGAVIGTMAISVVSEVLRRSEEGVTLGPVDVPGRPGLQQVGLAIIMLGILILRPRGITGGKEVSWPPLAVQRIPRVRWWRAAPEALPSRAAPKDAREHVDQLGSGPSDRR